MPMEASILKSTKKILGLNDAYDDFDLDVITQINTCFNSLRILGIGPPAGFMIEDETSEWHDFIEDEGDTNLNSVKTYVYLKSRLFFDAPGTPHHLTALKEQVTELEYTLLTERNLKSRLGGGDPSLGPDFPVVIQGGDLDG